MASTESVRAHALGAAHLAGCLRLSQSANWNQNAADWRLMLDFGRGYGLSLADGTLAASTLTLPYGERIAWVAMVLVLPECRRGGYATRLLRSALADLARESRVAVLDATPAGREVYRQEGFNDTWGFRRYALQMAAKADAAPVPGVRVRPLQSADWVQIATLDAQAFGGDRSFLLKSLSRRLPQAALVAEQGGQFAGFLLGRDGREACQLGPLVARDAVAARALLAAALDAVGMPAFIDLVDRESGLRAWLEGRGFVFQRPFTRMVLGHHPAPGEDRLVFCPAGPELG